MPKASQSIIRPPDIHVGELISYRDSSSFFFLFFVNYPSRSLNGTQWKLAICSEVSAIWKCMCKIFGIPSPYKPGVQNHPFSTTSQLNGKFDGLYLRNEIRYIKLGKCVENHTGCATSSQNDMNFGRQTGSNWTLILTHYVNSAFYFIARLQRRRPANGTQPKFAKRWTVNRENNLP